MSEMINRAGGRLKLAGLRVQSPKAAQAIVQARASGTTLLDRGALVDLYRAVQAIEASNREGILIEAGTARGGSALVMALAKSPARRFELYDTFAMIPPPSTKDGADAHERYDDIASGAAAGTAGVQYYGYESDLYGSVQKLFADSGLPPEANNIHLVKGLYEETLHVDAPVAMAHIDCDWYDSVLVCLNAIVPHLVVGGVLVIDDYDHWSGCRQAVDEFFGNHKDTFRFERRSRLQIIKR